MSVIEIVAALGITALGVTVLVGAEALVTGEHPWTSRARRRAAALRARQVRVSAIEHEIGLLPCSLPDCAWCRWPKGGGAPARAPRASAEPERSER